jgi:hypothetical protein
VWRCKTSVVIVLYLHEALERHMLGGGMVTSTVHVLLVTPIMFLIIKKRELRRRRLGLTGLRAEPGDALDPEDSASMQTQPAL